MQACVFFPTFCLFFSPSFVPRLGRLKAEGKSLPRRSWGFPTLLGTNILLMVEKSSWLVATQIFFIFHPNLGDIIQFDEHIFQMG